MEHPYFQNRPKYHRARGRLSRRRDAAPSPRVPGSGRLCSPHPTPGDELGCPLKHVVGRSPVTSGEHCAMWAAPGEATCTTDWPVRGPEQGTLVPAAPTRLGGPRSPGRPFLPAGWGLSADLTVTLRAWRLWENVSSVTTSVVSMHLCPQSRCTCTYSYISWSQGEGLPAGGPPHGLVALPVGWWPSPWVALPAVKSQARAVTTEEDRVRAAARFVITFVSTGAPEHQRGRGWRCRAPQELKTVVQSIPGSY